MSFPIGHVVEHEFSIDVCADCGARISSGGLCSYGCPADGDYDGDRVRIRRTFKRVETLIREERIEPSTRTSRPDSQTASIQPQKKGNYILDYPSRMK